MSTARTLTWPDHSAPSGYSGDTLSDPLQEAAFEPPSIECGYTVDGSTAENGTIVSPGYPDNYPAYLACKWRIQAAPGKKILATFSEFDVTASNNCNSDYVTVTTGGGNDKAC